MARVKTVKVGWVGNTIPGIAPIGSAPTAADFPMTGNTLGDVRTTDDTGHAHRWSGSAWIDIGQWRGDPGDLVKDVADTYYAAKAATEAATLGMPLVVTKNYTRHLSRYASLAAAVADLPSAGAKGGEIAVDGEIPWTTGTLPPNVHLIGRGSGATALLLPPSPTAPALVLDSASGALVADLAILLAEGSTSAASAYGIHVRGATDDVLIERVFLDRTSRGVNVEGWAGTTPGTVTNLTLRDVRADRSPSTFGFNFDDVDTVTLDNCRAGFNALNGVKFRRAARNVTVLGGNYSDNGTVGESSGLNAYAGGDSFTIIGGIYERNNGAGLSIKSGDLNQTDAATYGYVRNLRLTDVQSRDNAGPGYYVAVSNAADMAEPLISLATLTGCLAEGNTGSSGYLINARNVQVAQCVAKDNAYHGFQTQSRTIDVSFANCLAINNSQAGAGSYNGFDLTGHRGSLVNCRAIGTDTDDVSEQADYDALTKYHLYGFRVNSTATGRWVIEGSCESQYHTAAGNGIRTDPASGEIIVRQSGTLTPGTSPIYGGIGSEYIKTNGATAADTIWRKTSGAPNASTAGWQRVTMT